MKDEIERLVRRLESGNEISGGQRKRLLFLKQYLGNYNLIREMFKELDDNELKDLYHKNWEIIDKV